MLLLAALALALVSVPLARGRLSLVTEVRLRWAFLPVAAFFVQVLILEVLDLSPGAAALVHVATYVPLAVFFVVNRRHPGLMLLILGVAANGIVIAANDGIMPTNAAARERAGIESSEGFENSDVVEDARLPWLGDVLVWPEPLPFANVFSIGDVFVVAGVAVFLHQASESLLTARGRRQRRAARAGVAVVDEAAA